MEKDDDEANIVLRSEGICCASASEILKMSSHISLADVLYDWYVMAAYPPSGTILVVLS